MRARFERFGWLIAIVCVTLGVVFAFVGVWWQAIFWPLMGVLWTQSWRRRRRMMVEMPVAG